jgi:hypothetical protein
MKDNEGSPNTHQLYGQHEHTSKPPGSQKSQEDFRDEEFRTPATGQNPRQHPQKPTHQYPPRLAIFWNGTRLSSEETAQHWYERHYDANIALQKLQEEKKQWEMDRETLQYYSKRREMEASWERNGFLHQISQLRAGLEDEKAKHDSQKKQSEAHLNASVRMERENHRHETEKLNTVLNEARQRAKSEREQHSREMKKIQNKLNELETEHIQSINRIGTGLEPIATHTFEDRFRALHDEVS